MAWFHITCLTPAPDAQSPTLVEVSATRPEQPPYPNSSDDYNPMAPHKFTRAHYKLWQQLLRYPIQRGELGYKYPLSFESLTYM